MAQANSDLSVNMEISNGAVVHCPIGSCVEMEDRKSAEEEEDDVELAEEVDEYIHIVSEDGEGDNAMASNVHQPEQENHITDNSEEDTKPEGEDTQNESTREEKAESEVKEDRVTEPVVPELEIEVESSTTAESQPHAFEEACKEVIEPEHVLETRCEESDVSVKNVSEGQELLLSEVHGVDLISDEHANSESGDDETQQNQTETTEEHKEVEDVYEGSSREVEAPPALTSDDEGEVIEEEPSPADEETEIVSTFEEESESLQSLNEKIEPETNDMQCEGQHVNEELFQEVTHNDDESEIDLITAEEPSEVLIDQIDGNEEEKLQSLDQLTAASDDVVVTSEERESLKMDEVETDQEIDERCQAPEETSGDKETDEDVIEPKEEVEIIEEPPVEEAGSEEPERPQECNVDAPADVAEGGCEEPHQPAGDTNEQEVEKLAKRVNEEVSTSVEEGARQGKEEPRTVLEDDPKKKARDGGRKVTIPAWLKARDTVDVQEPPRPIGVHWRDTSCKSDGVMVKAKCQEVVMENGGSGISPSLVQQEEEKTRMKMKTKTTMRQIKEDADPNDLNVSLYVKVM